MVKVLQFPGEPTDESRNVRVFSTEIAECVRRCMEARALHPASIVGVLQYHAVALSSSFQQALMPEPPPAPSIIAPPPGFKP